MWTMLALFCFITAVVTSSSIKTYPKNVNDTLRFPDNFMFGAASAAYQVEGAWNVSDKGESIWDYMTHNRPWMIVGEANGDISSDQYHNYRSDVQIMADMGLNFYRFSLSWTRILPTGFANQISSDGIAYYNNLIDELLSRGIEPMVTLYHWDLPQRLSLLGGWTNALMPVWFEDFARVAFEQFGDRVKTWLTINEPHQICYFGYGRATHAPAIDGQGYAEYLCAYNLLMSHARAWRLYDEIFRPTQQGRISLALSTPVYEPETNSQDDIDAAEDRFLFENGLYAYPIFTEQGDFPARVKDRVLNNSMSQGFRRSRLPSLTEEEIEYIRGTHDFYSINHYTVNKAYRNSSVNGMHPVPSLMDDAMVAVYQPDEWEPTLSSWSKVTPWGIRSALNIVKERFGNPEILITENGVSSDSGLHDDQRVSYYQLYLEQILLAMIEDACNVTAYTAWSLLDNFEWNNGYRLRYGLYEVNFEDPARPRTARKSSYIYREIISSRVIDFAYDPLVGSGISSGIFIKSSRIYIILLFSATLSLYRLF